MRVNKFLAVYYPVKEIMSKINHSLERLETDYVDLYIIHREEGREMIPFCRDEKIAITPYSPLLWAFDS